MFRRENKIIKNLMSKILNSTSTTKNLKKNNENLRNELKFFRMNFTTTFIF